MALKVFLTGASGTGKTTLAVDIAKRYSYSLVESPTVSVASEFGGMENVSKNYHLMCDFQRRLARRQKESVLSKIESDHGFVFDRLLDTFAYAAIYAGIKDECQNFEAICDAMEKNSKDAVVFFLRPNIDVFTSAVKCDGNRRADYLDWPMCNRIDGAIHMMMISSGIPFVSLDVTSYASRIATVSCVMDKMILVK